MTKLPIVTTAFRDQQPLAYGVTSKFVNTIYDVNVFALIFHLIHALLLVIVKGYW